MYLIIDIRLQSLNGYRLVRVWQLSSSRLFHGPHTQRTHSILRRLSWTPGIGPSELDKRTFLIWSPRIYQSRNAIDRFSFTRTLLQRQKKQLGSETQQLGFRLCHDHRILVHVQRPSELLRRLLQIRAPGRVRISSPR
jgi:hypothetical protein